MSSKTEHTNSRDMALPSCYSDVAPRVLERKVNNKGKFIKTMDTIKMSPRDFLRIGKVQKEVEEPLTEAQVKHRDRSYIISKLNKSIQLM